MSVWRHIKYPIFFTLNTKIVASPLICPFYLFSFIWYVMLHFAVLGTCCVTYIPRRTQVTVGHICLVADLAADHHSSCPHRICSWLAYNHLYLVNLRSPLPHCFTAEISVSCKHISVHLNLFMDLLWLLSFLFLCLLSTVILGNTFSGRNTHQVWI